MSASQFEAVPHRSPATIVEIRPVLRADYADIHQLVRIAFGQDNEAILVERLRASQDYIPDLELVAVGEAQIVGHIMITKLEIVSDIGKPTLTTILAPLAVDPARQNLGVGSSLTRHALRRARELGHTSMILVGHPTYYPRFGFGRASQWGIRFATPIRDDVFMAIELVPGALEAAAGTVTLPPAFDGT